MRRVYKNSINILLFALLFLLVSFSFTNRSEALMSCMPTCSTTDARFLIVVVGPGFQTLTTDTLNLRIIIPGDQTEFTVGIFDGDSDRFLFNWDTGAPFLYRYTLKIDPDEDNLGPSVFEDLSTNFANNAWTDYTFPTSDLARNADGDFVYTLTAKALEPLNPAAPFVTGNSIKVRASGLVQIDEIFSFVSEATTIGSPGADLNIIYPNLDDSDGVGPEDKVGATYDGSFCFFFDLPEDTVEADFWDGDADRGNFDGTNPDTDDPNTPNTIPSFAPPETDVVAEGDTNTPQPFDDKDPNSDFNFLTLVEGTVSYSLIFPDGQVVRNDNPSANREWELFRVSTLTDDPSRVDAMVDQFPAGEYQICFEGLDINNFVSLRPLAPFILRGEVLPEEEIFTAVPTISEWGLISLAAAIAIIGIFTVRRRNANLGG
ncbi:MAG: hypothetical protein DHS20C13_02130 [Thermodesulfobacteriota bacterium]|nr:MAG: hypothetical protein DHS20C13_02130 [Thermodesulfobacteriota bacterium]